MPRTCYPYTTRPSLLETIITIPKEENHHILDAMIFIIDEE